EVERGGEEDGNGGRGGEGGHNGLEGREEKPGAQVPIRAGPERGAADAEAANEDRENGRRCGGARAEDQAELAKPGRLVDESAETGPEQQRRHRGGARAPVNAAASRRASARRRRRLAARTEGGPVGE